MVLTHLFPLATPRELNTYEHLSKLDSAHLGQSLIREVYDTFSLVGEAGTHQCLVQQPMHMSLLEMMRLNPRPFDLPRLEMTLRRPLSALDFLHTEAEVVHAGLVTRLESPSLSGIMPNSSQTWRRTT